MGLYKYLGFLNAFHFGGEYYVEVARIYPLSKDGLVRKVVIGDQPYEKDLFLRLPEGGVMRIDKECLEMFYFLNRERLTIELVSQGRKGKLLIRAITPFSLLEKFLKETCLYENYVATQND